MTGRILAAVLLLGAMALRGPPAFAAPDEAQGLVIPLYPAGAPTSLGVPEVQGPMPVGDIDDDDATTLNPAVLAETSTPLLLGSVAAARAA